MTTTRKNGETNGLKVAMLGWEFPPFMAGGLGIHCLELTQGLAARGVATDFYMPHMGSVEGPLRVADHHDHLRIREVEADPIGPYEGTGRGYDENFNQAVALYNDRLVDAFDSWDADVLHGHDWITMPAALKIRRRSGIPLVLTVHSTEFDRSAGFAPQAWIEDIERQGIRSADRVIAVSSYTRSVIQRQYAADPARIVPIPNGVDSSKFNLTRVRGDDEPARSVLFLSRLSRQKGPLFFLEAARRVLQRRPRTRFLMAGKGDMLRECVDFVLANDMAGRVEFTGFIPPDELANVYGQNDVYVLPSVSEPFGISVLEAMASGLPTIVSRTSGVGQGLRHVLKADYWDTDEMADLILRVMDSWPLRDALARNGAAEARRFTWDVTCALTLGVYEGLVAGAPPLQDAAA